MRYREGPRSACAAETDVVMSRIWFPRQAPAAIGGRDLVGARILSSAARRSFDLGVRVLSTVSSAVGIGLVFAARPLPRVPRHVEHTVWAGARRMRAHREELAPPGAEVCARRSGWALPHGKRRPSVPRAAFSHSASVGTGDPPIGSIRARRTMWVPPPAAVRRPHRRSTDRSSCESGHRRRRDRSTRCWVPGLSPSGTRRTADWSQASARSRTPAS